MSFKIGRLPYAYEALEPHISREIMKIHYEGHHATYVKNLNNLVKGEGLQGCTDLEELQGMLNGKTDELVLNGGGHYNHTMFWEVMCPESRYKEPSKRLLGLFEKFGGFQQFKDQFTKAAMSIIGSGWAWLSMTDEKDLIITTTKEQCNPLMRGKQMDFDRKFIKETSYPILCLDFWEHAYYLQYHNNKRGYLDSWWNIVNWDEVENRYDKAIKRADSELPEYT